MKRGLGFHASFTNRVLYTFIFVIVLLIVGVGVFAFGTSSPVTFGHSAGELDLSAGVNGNAVFNGNAAFNSGVTVAGVLTANSNAILNGNVGVAGQVSSIGDVCTNQGGGVCLSSVIGGNVPSGAVMAFDLSSCPFGWSNYDSLRGRTIIGAGQGSGLTNRTFGETGGEETNTLTINEMPSHIHSSTPQAFSRGSFKGFGSSGSLTSTNTGATGGSQPHNVMQPYMALLYCVKD